jgi:hypothetical protein
MPPHRILAVLVALSACRADRRAPSHSRHACCDSVRPVLSSVRPTDTLAVSESAFTFDTTTRIADRRLAINGLMPGETESQLRRAFGKPLSRSDTQYRQEYGDTVWTLTYRDLTVRFARHRIDHIVCLSPTCATADGVRLGDSWAKVHEVYGPSDPNGAWHSSATYWGRRCDCAMTFEFKGPRVVSIEIWVDES